MREVTNDANSSKDEIESLIPDAINRTILHIGMPRTGSTFIQNTCEVNRAGLLRQGVFYPKVGHVREEGLRRFRTSGHNQWWLDGVLRGDRGPVRAIREEIAGARGVDTVLLSSEELFFVLDDYQFSRIARALSRTTTRIVVYLRRQDDWFESMYAEAVTGGYFKITRSFDDFRDEAARSLGGVPAAWANGDLNYYRWLESLSSYFGRENIFVRAFEEAQSADDLFGDFLNLCGLAPIPDRTDADAESANGAFGSAEDVEVMRFFNNLPFDNDEHYRRFLGGYHRWLVQTGRRGRPLFFQDAARQEFLDRYEESNSQIARDYLHRSDGMLFQRFVPKGELIKSNSIPVPVLEHAYRLYVESRSLDFPKAETGKRV